MKRVEREREREREWLHGYKVPYSIVVPYTGLQQLVSLPYVAFWRLRVGSLLPNAWKRFTRLICVHLAWRCSWTTMLAWSLWNKYKFPIANCCWNLYSSLSILFWSNSSSSHKWTIVLFHSHFIKVDYPRKRFPSNSSSGYHQPWKSGRSIKRGKLDHFDTATANCLSFKQVVCQSDVVEVVPLSVSAWCLFFCYSF